MKIGLFALIVTFATCSCFAAPGSRKGNEEVVTYTQPTVCPEAMSIPDVGDRHAEASSAVALVRQFFSSAFAKRYDLFSEEMRAYLLHAFEIPNAAEYAKREQNNNHERVETSVRVIGVAEVSKHRYLVTTLVCWEQTGDSGFESESFEVVDYQGVWKIDRRR